jgi:hypothetical protein
MFEIIVSIHLIVRDAQMDFVSETKFPTREICEKSIPSAYEELKGHILNHMIERFEVKKDCRPVGKDI